MEPAPTRVWPPAPLDDDGCGDHTCRGAKAKRHWAHLSLSTADENINSINFMDLKFCFFMVLPG